MPNFEDDGPYVHCPLCREKAVRKMHGDVPYYECPNARCVNYGGIPISTIQDQLKAGKR
jgi:hypothetical protein